MSPSLRARRRRGWIAATLILVLVSGGLAYHFHRRGAADGESSSPALPAATAPITRQNLVRTTTLEGNLDYGPAVPLVSRAAGVVTWLPEAGSVIERGGVLFRADEQPVVLLIGPLPMYRTLGEGSEGADVQQLERNLRELGYGGFTVDKRFTAATGAAVRRWQRALGREETGTVDMTWVSYADGPLRIAERIARLGAEATGEVLKYTGVVRMVTVAVPTTGGAWATVGTPVTVTLPDGREVAGKVSAVGTEATAPGGATAVNAGGTAAEATIQVSISIADQRDLGTLQRAPVQVRHVAQRRENVLTVPVTALLALIEGGYGLELVEGDRTRLVRVRTGLAADGRIEVSGAELAEGMLVGVPG